MEQSLGFHYQDSNFLSISQCFNPSCQKMIMPNYSKSQNIQNNENYTPNNQQTTTEKPAPSHKRINWTFQDNQNIIEFVNTFGPKWKTLSQVYPGRTPKQYREHYMNHLQKQVEKKPFTKEEDCFLIDFIQRHGRKFSLCAKKMPGRTENSVKNRWYSLFKLNNKSPNYYNNLSAPFEENHSSNNLPSNEAIVQSNQEIIEKNKNSLDSSNVNSGKNEMSDTVDILLSLWDLESLF